MTAKDGLLMFQYVVCKKTYDKNFDEDLSQKFESTADMFE